MHTDSTLSINNIKRTSYYKYKSTNANYIKNIFTSYWDLFLSVFPKLNIRTVVYEEIDKIIKCGTIDNGYTFYDCPHCGNFIIVPHTCKSRFCSSCGNKYNMDRSLNAKKRFMNVKHRHIVFTIPQKLRNIFLEHREYLNDLFEAVNETFIWMFNPKRYQNKEKKKNS